MERALDWMASLPPLMLYFVLAVVAAVENIFPPFPADTVVAFGSFLAARGEASVLGSFLATWTGNLVGAAAMYVAGRRLGAEWIHRRFGGPEAEARIRALHGRYGLFALFLSRFLPGIRALVPPVAGALRLPALPSLAAMGIASGIWYGFVTWLSFRAGETFDDFSDSLAGARRWVAIGSAIAVAITLVVWVIVSRRRRARA